jgi:hypothetical protein
VTSSNIERLDRRAEALGLRLERPTKASRRFKLGDRTMTYRSAGGRGVVQIEATGGDFPDAVVHTNIERLESYLIRAAEEES